MLKLEAEEKILLVLHHHWVSLVVPSLTAAALFLAPLFAFPFVVALERASVFLPLFFFISCVWFLVSLLIGFVFWVEGKKIP